MFPVKRQRLGTEKSVVSRDDRINGRAVGGLSYAGVCRRNAPVLPV